MSILGDALKGRFLGAVDLPDHEYPPNAVTAKIADLTEENLAREGQPAERKPILHFDPKGDPADLKPMACNKTNAKFLIKHFRTDDETKIIGRTIGIFVDPTVQNAQGAVVGGLRLCAPLARHLLPRSPSLVYLHLHEFLRAETASCLPLPPRCPGR